MMGASCTVGPFSAVSTSRDAALTPPKSHRYLLLGTVSAASQLVDTAENGPTAHEAPIMVLFSSSAVFRQTERYRSSAVESEVTCSVHSPSAGGAHFTERTDPLSRGADFISSASYARREQLAAKAKERGTADAT